MQLATSADQVFAASSDLSDVAVLLGGRTPDDRGKKAFVLGHIRGNGDIVNL